MDQSPDDGLTRPSAAVRPGEVTPNEPFPVTAGMVEEAIRRADGAGQGG